MDTPRFSFLVEVEGEHETPQGWLYTFRVRWEGDEASATDHELTLSWVDHEHLTGGSVSPSVIGGCAARVAAGHFGPALMPARCDVSILRRRISDFADRLRSALEAGGEPFPG